MSYRTNRRPKIWTLITSRAKCSILEYTASIIPSDALLVVEALTLVLTLMIYSQDVPMLYGFTGNKKYNFNPCWPVEPELPKLAVRALTVRTPLAGCGCSGKVAHSP